MGTLSPLLVSYKPVNLWENMPGGEKKREVLWVYSPIFLSPSLLPSLHFCLCLFSTGHYITWSSLHCKTWLTSLIWKIFFITLLMVSLTYLCWICTHSLKPSSKQEEKPNLSIFSRTKIIFESMAFCKFSIMPFNLDYFPSLVPPFYC